MTTRPCRPPRRRTAAAAHHAAASRSHAEGSVLIAMGDTHVLCTASVEEGVPPFLKGKGQGWLTAEYGMLPRATNTRMRREAAEGKQSGRTQEIQRLIGRSLRAVIDLAALGERTIRIDCDVLQADGGTRCASITGACVAVADAIAWCRRRGLVTGEPLRDFVAAVSVGIVDGVPVLDLDYAEDSNCDTDMNVVMTGAGGFVEVQGTAEGAPFSRARDGRAGRARASGGIARAASPRRRAGAGAAVIARASSSRPATRASCASSARLLAPLGIDVDRAGGARHPGGGRAARHVRRERARQGAARERARASLPALADDSGVCVDALGGAPGVQSRALRRRAARPTRATTRS